MTDPGAVGTAYRHLGDVERTSRPGERGRLQRPIRPVPRTWRRAPSGRPSRLPTPTAALLRVETAGDLPVVLPCRPSGASSMFVADRKAVRRGCEEEAGGDRVHMAGWDGTAPRARW